MPVLFTIETETARLVWSRARAKQPAVLPEAAAVPFGLTVEALDGSTVPTVQLGATDGYLFEQTGYTLFVQSRTVQTVAVRHADPVLLRGLHHSDDERVVHGTLDFGTQVGRSRFVVEAGGTPHLAFTVEVFPSKLDYRLDYDALRDDVEALAGGLALDYLRATTQPGTPAGDGPPPAAGWLALLHRHLDTLEGALRHLAAHPYWSTAPGKGAARADRLRRVDAAVRQAVRRQAGRGRSLPLFPDAPPIREHLPAAPHRYTLDTPEHRWLAARLRRIRRRLSELEAAVTRRPGPRQVEALHEMAGLRDRVTELLRLPPLQAADPEAAPVPTLRLQAAPGYREAHLACLALQRGLHLHGGPLALSLKDLHLLYEMWCFLTLVRLLADEAGSPLPVRDLIAVETDGLRLRLRRGAAQTVRLDLPVGRLRLVYNPRFGGRDYLVPQQPDFLLERHDGGRVTRAVLDAKYRLDASTGYRRRYGMPGPPAEALNTLHRYRDAIRLPVAQAVALFPWRDEAGAFATGRHRRSLDEIGVGAIPLLPGETRHLQGWLRSFLTR